MSIDSVGGTSVLSQLYSTQQAQAMSAVSVDAPMDLPSADSTAASTGSNALTGTATSNLDSQTLQALLDLTQQDPGDASQTGQNDQAGQSGQTGQTGRAHHHHHHGGGMQATAPASAQTPAGDPSQTATAAADTESDTLEASLPSALLNA